MGRTGGPGSLYPDKVREKHEKIPGRLFYFLLRLRLCYLIEEFLRVPG